MYAIVGCPNCRRTRMIDLSNATSTCPYCGKRCTSDKLNIRFSHEDPSVVRDVMQGNRNVPERSKGEDADPMDVLAFRVSHCRDVREKMCIIVAGLCDIKGEFTEEDVESLVPGKGKAYLKIMLDECMVHETRYGRYTE
ncbi:MAG: DUF5817 domain-containing protein [Candidatus Methanomethylophilaceae archaeon]